MKVNSMPSWSDSGSSEVSTSIFRPVRRRHGLLISHRDRR